MKVIKAAAAGRSYGRGMDNHRTPASYAVVNEAGVAVGVIMGSSAGYMERSTWEVCWLSANGMPRTVKHADTFKEAKAWAEAWDGSIPERMRAIWTA